jgi:hypothetical protein
VVTESDLARSLPATVTRVKTGYQMLVRTSNLGVVVVPAPSVAEGLNAVSPARIAETRSVSGARTIDGVLQGVGAVGSGETLRVPVLGRAGVPSSGVSAEVVNVTMTGPTPGGFLTVAPTGQTRPETSSLNLLVGQTMANSAIAQVGSDGSISIANTVGFTHVIADISGWFPENSAATR